MTSTSFCQNLRVRLAVGEWGFPAGKLFIASMFKEMNGFKIASVLYLCNRQDVTGSQSFWKEFHLFCQSTRLL